MAVSATVQAPVSTASLHYLVGFGAETVTPMTGSAGAPAGSLLSLPLPRAAG